MLSKRAARFLGLACAVLLAMCWCEATIASAQAPKPPPDTTDTDVSDEASAEDTEQASAPPIVPKPGLAPPIPPPPVFPVLPFQFSFKGTVAVTLFAQDTAVLAGNGLASLVSPVAKLSDSWIMGGDVRQTRF